MSRFKSRLVVSAPYLGDPNFDETVVLMLEHGAEGALGVVLNRPGEMSISAALPMWNRLAAEPDRVFHGGPVELEVGIALGRITTGVELAGAQTVADHIVVLDLDGDPDEIPEEAVRMRLFSGYAGWSPGQLEREIRQGGWYVVDLVPDDVITTAPEDLWKTVMERQGGSYSAIANHPPEPGLN